MAYITCNNFYKQNSNSLQQTKLNRLTTEYEGLDHSLDYLLPPALYNLYHCPQLGPLRCFFLRWNILTSLLHDHNYSSTDVN